MHRSTTDGESKNARPRRRDHLISGALELRGENVAESRARVLGNPFGVCDGRPLQDGNPVKVHVREPSVGERNLRRTQRNLRVGAKIGAGAHVDSIEILRLYLDQGVRGAGGHCAGGLAESAGRTCDKRHATGDGKPLANLHNGLLSATQTVVAGFFIHAAAEYSYDTPEWPAWEGLGYLPVRPL
jgi:hypothetical protein